MGEPEAPPPGSAGVTTGAGLLLSISGAGVTGTHADRTSGRVVVAPATAAAERNTLRPTTFPVACWRAADVNFDFDTAFVSPRIKPAMVVFKALLDAHPGCPVTLFGHADPVGNDDYNKALSGRRAQAIYALLARRADLWEDLHAQGDLDDRAHRAMLGELGFVPDAAAVKAFQSAAGLPATGFADAATRKQLYLQYMDAVCRDAQDQPYQVAESGFLGQGADKGGKADYQGCGEFNPVLLFSQEEKAELERDKPRRNEENAPNRRVLALLFPAGATAGPTDWPCPRAKEGGAGCRARFFLDHRRRLAEGPERREFKQTRDTFACRFYHHLNAASPCERFKVGDGLLLAQVLAGDGRIELSGRTYEIRSDNAGVRLSGVLDDLGMLRHELVPPGIYTLSVQGCSEDSALPVLLMTETRPVLCVLENGRLAIHVRTPEGIAVADAQVEVEGLGTRLTDSDGVAYFGSVPAREWRFTATKDGFRRASGRGVPIEEGASGDPTADRAQVSTTLVNAVAELEPAVKLTGVHLEQAGARSTRGDQELPRNQLGSITARDADVVQNPPRVFIRGGDMIQIVAEPAGVGVKWSLTPGPGADATGTELTASLGPDTLLSTGGTGLFTVAAEHDKDRVVCNIVLAAVELDTPRITTTDQRLQDLARFSQTPAGAQAIGGTLDPTRMTGVASGNMVLGEHPWESDVRVTVRGGGADGRLGIEKVRVHVLQNIVGHTVVGDYGRVRVFHEVPARLLDANKGSPSGWTGPSVGTVNAPGKAMHGARMSPFLFSPGMWKVVSNDLVSVRFTVGDSPVEGYKNFEADDGLTAITGATEFRTAVVAFSADAANAVVAIADAVWSVDYTGTVNQDRITSKTFRGEWVRTTANVRKVQDWQALKTSSGRTGTTVFNALLELFPPLAIDLFNAPPTGRVDVK